jgi:hypothetical protein
MHIEAGQAHSRRFQTRVTTACRPGGPSSVALSFACMLGAMLAGACGLSSFLGSPTLNAGIPSASSEVVAVAGPDLVVLEGSRVVLNGHGSRALAGTPVLVWSQVDGPPAVLSNPSSAAPFLTAPLGPARLVFRLTASVGDESDTDEVDVVVVRTGIVGRPVVQPSPPDRIVDAGDGQDLQGAGGATVEVDLREPVVFSLPWHGRGRPLIGPRCPLRENTKVEQDGNMVVIALRPAVLPCAIVVDDDAREGRANRIALVLWPASTRAVIPTQAQAPTFIEPGASIMVETSGPLLWAAADGRPLAVSTRADGFTFLAPRTLGPLALVLERREEGRSGGVVVLDFVVRSSQGNSSPLLFPLDDLVVRPLARFRLAATATDNEGDSAVVSSEQVFGANATAVPDLVNSFTAPSEPSTLLFHLRADDGTSVSAPMAVRVVVDDAAVNRPPDLNVPPTLFAVPGAAFVLDATSARDPDDGIVVGHRIQQDPADARILLPEPLDASVVELRAVDAGDEMHFSLSAFDSGGLFKTARVTVVVEDAGPYVDPIRGDDLLGNGTAATPFATVSTAIATAARHRFPALHLAVGLHAPFDGALPDGLGLQGGFHFDGNTYLQRPENNDEDESENQEDDDEQEEEQQQEEDEEVEEGTEHEDSDTQSSRTTLPLGAAGLLLTGAQVAHLDLQSGPIRTVRTVSLVDTHADGLLTVAEGAHLTVRDSTLGGGVRAQGARVLLENTAVSRGLTGENADIDTHDSRIEGTPALALEGGVLVLEQTEVSAVEQGVVLRDCVSSLNGNVVVSGGSAESTGLWIEGGTATLAGLGLVVEGAGNVTGALVQSANVFGQVAVRVRGGLTRGVKGSSVVLADSDVDAAGDEVVAVDGEDVRLTRSRLTASGGTRAQALRATRGEVEASVLRVQPREPPAGEPTTTAAADVDFIAAAVGHVTLRHATLLGPTGIAALGGTPVVRNVVLAAQVPWTGVVEVGVVGVVLQESDDLGREPFVLLQDCAGCIVGPTGVLDADGRLVPSTVLGAPHPFVDVGDTAFAVDFDIDGDPSPQGLGPDLGADEVVDAPTPL